MDTTFYIHIGMPKTGSTSIQHTLFDNREKLLTQGINYLSIGRNHAGALMSLLSDEPHKYSRNVRRSIDTPKKAQLYNDAIRRRLADELSKNVSSKFVISGEAFSAANRDKILRLKEILDPYAGRYRIIVYVRDPYEYINSAALQRVKGGALLDDSIDGSLPRFRRLQTFIQVFGREHIDIRIFDPNRFVGGSLIGDFLDALGESPELQNGLNIVSANRSLSHEAAVMLSEVNIVAPVHINGYANRQRATSVRVLMESIEGVKYSCNPQSYLEHEKSILSDLEWLHGQIGEQVFARPLARPASVPQWGETTVRSIQNLVRGMALTMDQLSSDRKAPTPLPAELGWLKNALDTRISVWPPLASRAAPQFNKTTVRLLASLIHDMAFKIENLRAEAAAPQRKKKWQIRFPFFAQTREMRLRDQEVSPGGEGH